MATTVNEGVLFRSVQALLTAHSIKAIAFDKTGTLSQGVMAVHSTSYDPDPQSVRLIHAITASNKHPVSETARRYLESQHPELKSDLLLDSSASKPSNELADIEVIPGKGVSANFFGFEVKAGNAKFTNTESLPLVNEYLTNGMTILVITLGQQLIGLFGMKDQPRPGVPQLISDLGRDGRQISLVSGDNPSAVHAFARGVGIDPTHVYASQTPVSKAKVVESLQQAYTPGKVAFVGDGINDIIALSTSDISIATGSASNASSQVNILSNDVPKAMRSILATSRLTRNHVVASLAFCGVYFTVAILLASGVTGWRIPPAYAGLGELVSILPVLLVGAHLAVFKSIARRLVAA
jgi:Cu2+-exporting ATPase